MKTAIKPREAPARERSCTEPKAEEASWVERGLARARRSLPEAVMARRWPKARGTLTTQARQRSSMWCIPDAPLPWARARENSPTTPRGSAASVSLIWAIIVPAAAYPLSFLPSGLAVHAAVFSDQASSSIPRRSIVTSSVTFGEGGQVVQGDVFRAVASQRLRETSRGREGIAAVVQ